MLRVSSYVDRSWENKNAYGSVAIELWLARLLHAWYESWNATWPPGLMYKQNVYVAVLGVQVASYLIVEWLPLHQWEALLLTSF